MSFGCVSKCKHLRNEDVSEKSYDIYKTLYGNALKADKPRKERPMRDLEGFCRRNGIITA